MDSQIAAARKWDRRTRRVVRTLSVTSARHRYRAPLWAAVAFTLAFIIFTGWWLVDGGAGLDSTLLRFTGWLLHGALDVVVSDSWPLGEPEIAVAVVGVAVLLLMRRRRNREAALVVGGFVVLSTLQLVIVLSLAEVGHVKLDIESLSHLYPSGHAARVPFLGTALAMIGPPKVRSGLFAVTAILAVALALDRTDSRIQTGSVVVGGLLMGIAVSAWFATLYTAWVRGSKPDETLPGAA